MMKKFLAKTVSLVLMAALVAIGFSGCNSNQTGSSAEPSAAEQSSAPAASEEAAPQEEASEAASGDSLEGSKLRLAINATFAPFESVTVNEKGENVFEGIDIDIANYLAQQLGFEIEITDMTFDGLVGALTSGRADFVISGISPTQERLKSVDFSTSYFYPSIAIISRKDNPKPTPESLNGEKVAVPFGTSYEAKAQSFENVEIVSITGTPAVIQELKNNRVAAAVIDGCQAAEFIKVHPDLEFHLLPIEKNLEDSFAIAFPKGSELKADMDRILVEMLENGEFDKIIVKWLGEDYLASYKAGIQ